jgi:hypothetical protein
MKRVLIIASLMIVAATSAQAADQFYIAKDQSTNKCKIVKSKPDGTKLVLIGTDSYATKAEAKSARKAAAECKKST